MSNTYSQLTVQTVFAVKHRQNIIAAQWRDELHKYLTGVLTNEGAKSLAVGGWKDHVHLLFGLPVTKSVSDLMRVVKSNSSKWVNEKRFISGKFQWQEGYGAFSYGKRDRNAVINYIMNQEEHHKVKSFREEYLDMLNEFEVVYQPKYLFEFYE
jgi:putative transposase